MSGFWSDWYGFFFFFFLCDWGWSAVSGFLFRWDFGGWSGLINDGGNVDLAAAVSGFWSGFFFFFPLLWSGLIGDVWVFVPVGFWWLIWVDRWWRKHWSSGGGVWVLIGVHLGFFFCFFCCDRAWSAMCGFLFRWDFGVLSGLIGEVFVFVPVGFWWLIWVDRRWRKHWSSGGGVWVLIGVDLSFFLFFLLWSGLIGDVWVFFPVRFWWFIWVDRRSLCFCSGGILVVYLG